MLSETRKQLTQLFMITSIKPLDPEAFQKSLMEIFEVENQAQLVTTLSSYVANREALESMGEDFERLEYALRQAQKKAVPYV